MIKYPRKCEMCEHIANNQASWWNHNKTHEPIPLGTLCDFGCGKPAKHRKTSGKFSCEQISQHCPAYLAQHSQNVKKQWKNNDWTDRRALNAKRTLNETTEERNNRVAKSIKTKLEKRIAAENTYTRRQYNRAVLYHSKKNYEIYKSQINPYNHPIGKNQYHIDHKVSRFVGWLLGLPVDTISHPFNLCMLPAADNCSKGGKCSLHPLQLLTEIKPDTNLIFEIETKLHIVEHLIPAR